MLECPEPNGDIGKSRGVLHPPLAEESGCGLNQRQEHGVGAKALGHLTLNNCLTAGQIACGGQAGQGIGLVAKGAIDR